MHYALSFPRNFHVNSIFYAFMSEHIKNILPCSEGGDIIYIVQNLCGVCRQDIINLDFSEEKKAIVRVNDLCKVLQLIKRQSGNFNLVQVGIIKERHWDHSHCLCS